MTVSLVSTITKTDSTPWGLTKVRDQGSYTDDEFNTIIKPYWDWLESQQGFVSYHITFPDANTKVSTLVVDTEDNARKLMSSMYAGKTTSNTLDPVANAYINLIKTKSSSNTTVTFETIGFENPPQSANT